MNPSRTRLYAATLFAALFLIIFGGHLVTSRSPVAPTQSALTWSGGAPLSAYQSANSQPPQQMVQDVIQNPNPAMLSLPPLSSSSPSVAQPAQNSRTYQDFIAQLSGGTSASPANGGSNASANTLINEAYQFIPTGLVATSASAKKPMTAEQRVLYDYGNEAGGEIQSFEELHTNEAQTLKDQAQDRSNPVKAAALASLGQGLAGVGAYLQQMQSVPSDVTSQHDALAQSYVDIGTKLQLVAQAQGDASFVQAIETYDTSADTFVRNYAALAQFFSERGVVFAPQDPGSVFSFTDTGGAGGL